MNNSNAVYLLYSEGKHFAVADDTESLVEEAKKIQQDLVSFGPSIIGGKEVLVKQETPEMRIEKIKRVGPTDRWFTAIFMTRKDSYSLFVDLFSCETAAIKRLQESSRLKGFPLVEKIGERYNNDKTYKIGNDEFYLSTIRLQS